MGAARRHRAVRFEPFFEDEVILACPPGHHFADRTVTLDELRAEQLIVMQEGAGVRQIVEDELRAAGTRLRDLDVRLELGLQESVRSAVQAGFGIAFISRSAVESELAAGTLVAARVEGIHAIREISLVRVDRPAGDAGGRCIRLVRARAAGMIVRWGLGELAGLLAELGVARPFVFASPRWSELPLRAHGRWSELPSDRISEIAAATAGADVLVALGGGSTIDTGKAVSAETSLPLVSIPTTYSGAEWTGFYGVRDSDRRMRGGGAGARLAGIVYDPELTLELPTAETVGTALNALAHCAEALYVKERNDDADRHALEGARLIAIWLPRVVADEGERLEARTELLRGALRGRRGAGGLDARARPRHGTGARRPLRRLPWSPQRACVCRPRSASTPKPRRCCRSVCPGDRCAMIPAARVEELARLAGIVRLRDLGVPESELDEVAEAVIVRAGARSNPRQATAAEVAELLRSIW